ncbi:MAG: hypothetical protein ABII68_09510 [Pseudomonadota bacterium]
MAEKSKKKKKEKSDLNILAHRIVQDATREKSESKIKKDKDKNK